MRTAQKGFTLIELMIVLAIIGILVVVALQMRKPYISEGMQMMGAIQEQISTFFTGQGTLPTKDEFDSLELKTTGVTNIVYAPEQTNTLTASFENITGQLQFDWNGGDWTCHNSTTDPLDSKILPKDCQ